MICDKLLQGNKRKIKIISDNIIRVNDLYITTPIYTPFPASMEQIGYLVSIGCDVVQVMDDGREIKLDKYNYLDCNCEDDRPHFGIIDTPSCIIGTFVLA